MGHGTDIRHVVWWAVTLIACSALEFVLAKVQTGCKEYLLG